MDTYVRAYMDVEGYVPIALVCNYYNVACFGCSYYDILNKLKEVAGRSKFYELDEENETIRLKEGWEKVSTFPAPLFVCSKHAPFDICTDRLFLCSLPQFLLPNPYGGRGLPRYVKQPTYSSISEEGLETEGAATTEASTEGAAEASAEGVNWSEADTTALA